MDKAFMERYSKVSLDRCVDYFRHDLRDWSPLEWGGALMGEVGELCNVLKKLDRVEKDLSPATRDKDVRDSGVKKIITEVGDCYAYLDLTAQRMGTTLLHCATIANYHEPSKKQTIDVARSALKYGAIVGASVGALLNHALIPLDEEEKSPTALRLFPSMVIVVLHDLENVVARVCQGATLEDCATIAFNDKSREIGALHRV